jgi:hypothetical protein
MSFLISRLKKSVSVYLNKPPPKSELEATTEKEMIDEEPVVESNEVIEPAEKTEYEYIQEDDLSQKFGIDRDLSKNYKLDICIYKINNKLEKPFVEFYFEKAAGSYTFIEGEITSVMFESIKPEETIPLAQEVTEHQDGVESDNSEEDQENEELEENIENEELEENVEDQELEENEEDQELEENVEAEAKAKEEEEAKAKEEEEAKAKEEEAKAKEEEEAKAKEEQEAKAKEEEEAKAKEEAEAKAKEEAEAKAKAEIESRIEAETKAKEQAEIKAKEEAEARVKAEEEFKSKEAEAEARVKEEAEARAIAETRANEEAAARASAEAKVKEESEARAIAETRANSEAKAKEEAVIIKQKLEQSLKTLPASPIQSPSTKELQSSVIPIQPVAEPLEQESVPSTQPPSVPPTQPVNQLKVPPDANIIDIRSDKMKGGNRTSDIEEIYMKKCNELIESRLKDITTQYKGFTELDGKIYAIFEKTDEIETALSSGSKFVIIDEIINKKKVLDVSIPENITKNFNENSELLKIKEKGGNELENPIAVYLCKKNGVTYENFYEDDKTVEEVDQIMHHDTLGDVYLFTTEPINNVGSFFSFFTGGKKAKRYALFLEDEITIENKDKLLPEFFKNSSKKLDDYFTHNCIGYTEAGRNFWAVKSRELFTEI